MKMILKYALVVVFAFLAYGASAQKPFEGTIKYTSKYLGEGADQLAAFAASGSTIRVRGNEMTYEVEGGLAAAMMGKMVIKPSENTLYIIKNSEQKVYKIKTDGDDNSEEESGPTVVKENETIKIQGLKCQKYKVTLETDQGDVTQFIWATDEYELSLKKKNRASDALTVQGIKGIAMKKMTIMNMMGAEITVTETVSEFSTEKPDKKEFDIPSSYEVEETTMEEFMGGMMGR